MDVFGPARYEAMSKAIQPDRYELGRHAATLTAEQVPTAIYLATALKSGGRTADAERVLAKVLAVSPSEHGARRLLAQLHDEENAKRRVSLPQARRPPKEERARFEETPERGLDLAGARAGPPGGAHAPPRRGKAA
eukprot:CAMPEP_0170157658 /NCGR_PEP_ID=MMETSP0033_2-20121228/66387_1 /TAXON_ID=195969 /ORGANISM="Dolichomastix tenuilepis, Strain CCMP3274" /LENGTH=135 /DNA_ID=CAMNT_0010395059 /DNA_START=21 /DNA_END=424 /DNA_ORIENTATION=-